MATRQTSIRMSEATRGKVDELARRYGTITEVVAVAIDRMHREIGIVANFVTIAGGDVVVWEGPGDYAPRQEGRHDWTHIRWYRTTPGDAYREGLGTPTRVEEPADLED